MGAILRRLLEPDHDLNDPHLSLDLPSEDALDHCVELDDDQDDSYYGILARAGFDDHTGVDTVLQHEGTMLAAGFAMMEEYHGF